VISAIRILKRALTATLPNLLKNKQTSPAVKKRKTEKKNNKFNFTKKNSNSYNNVQSNKLPLRLIGRIFFACSLSAGSPPLITIFYFFEKKKNSQHFKISI